mgnify:CR=1 FL=1
MDYTEEQLERIYDKLRSAGFVFDEQWNNDHFARIADCVLEALEIELPE